MSKSDSSKTPTPNQQYKIKQAAINIMEQKLLSSIQNLKWETMPKPALLVALANINDLQEELELAILDFRRTVLTR